MKYKIEIHLNLFQFIVATPFKKNILNPVF